MNFLRFLIKPKREIPVGINQILHKQLLWMLLLRVVLYTSLLGIIYFLSDIKYGIIILPNSILILLLLFVYTITIISALLLNNLKVNLLTFGFVQSIFDSFFASLLVYYTGISHSIYSSVYFFSIIAGGLILPRRGGLLAASTSTLLFGLLLLLEYKGYVPEYFSTFDSYPAQNLRELINLFSVKGLTFFLAAFLSAMFGIRLTTTEEVLSNTIDSFDKLSQLYKMIFDNISTGIITTDDHYIITSANNAARSITGFKLSELIGHNLSDVFPTLDLENKAIRQAIDFKKPNDSTIRIGYSLTSVHVPQRDPAHPQPDSKFMEDSKLLTLQDISEVEKLERKIRQGEKMAAIGMMSAGIAHDFRNPLTAISGSAQVLQKEFSNARSSEGSENLALTNIILRESTRLITTIADFLKFARPDILERQWFSLRSCIEEVLQVCKADPAWPKTSSIELDIDPWTDMWADEKQFFTVISHLIQNSIAFCPPGNEKIIIRAREKKEPVNEEVLQLSIDDNGIGIEESLQEKIFEPFYTTRADGTGLGLAIVKQTIDSHRGTIELRGSDLGGCRFVITMPLT